MEVPEIYDYKMRKYAHKLKHAKSNQSAMVYKQKLNHYKKLNQRGGLDKDGVAKYRKAYEDKIDTLLALGGKEEDIDKILGKAKDDDEANNGLQGLLDQLEPKKQEVETTQGEQGKLTDINIEQLKRTAAPKIETAAIQFDLGKFEKDLANRRGKLVGSVPTPAITGNVEDFKQLKEGVEGVGKDVGQLKGAVESLKTRVANVKDGVKITGQAADLLISDSAELTKLLAKKFEGNEGNKEVQEEIGKLTESLSKTTGELKELLSTNVSGLDEASSLLNAELEKLSKLGPLSEAPK